MKELCHQKTTARTWGGRWLLFVWWLRRVRHFFILRPTIVRYNQKHPYILDRDVRRGKGIGGLVIVVDPEALKPHKLYRGTVIRSWKFPFDG